MKPFFASTERALKLRAAARDWLGTPFRAHSQAKGAGVDCVHLAAAIYKECGVITEFAPPNYTLDQGMHLTQSAVEHYVVQTGCFTDFPGPVAFEKLMIGDLLLIKMGRVSHHVGILTSAENCAGFIHVFQGFKVHECDLMDPTWRKRIEKVYRPIEK